ncbi:hypothetical protein V8B97DRAFT_1057735 [Scleroderma yunnanense]
MLPLAEISGSNVRDFCMLERNYLSHFKLTLLLLLLSCSAILNTRLPAPPGSGGGHTDEAATFKFLIGILQYIAALLTIAAAVWEYHTGIKDLLKVRAFLVGTKVHFALMAVVSAIVIVTCIMYIATGSR